MNASDKALSGALLTLLERSEAAPLALSTRVYRAVRDAIVDGTLPTGSRLPSTRVLAQDLGVSRSTAEAAYGQLEAEGYLRRSVGDGSYVQAPAVVPRRPRAVAASVPSLSRRGRLIAGLGSCTDPLQVRAFSAGLPALDAFPFEIWQRLVARHLRSAPQAAMMYADPQGLPELRAAIAGYLGLSRGVECDADQVIVLTSSQQALVLVANLLLDPGDATWLEEPGYRGAHTAFAAAGAHIVPVPVDEDGLQVQTGMTLAPRARVAYVTPSHQYPLGMTLSLPRRMALLEWARRADAWIVEDDYDSEFHYDGRPVAAIHGLDRHGRVLYLGTFSKSVFPGLRIAYLVVPKPLVPAFTAARAHLDGHSAPLQQAVLADFMQDGHFMAHVRRMRELYRARRDVLLEEVERRLGSRLQAQACAGGLQVACLLRDQRQSDGRLAAKAGIAGIELPLLSRLYRGEPRRGGFVMGFSALPPGEIRNGVRRLEDAWGA